MDPLDTPPYEPIDAEPTRRPADVAPARTGTSGGPTDRTKKVVAIAAVASFLTAMVGMAAARSGDDGKNGTSTSTPASSTAPSDDDGFEPFAGRDGSQLQPGAAQPGVPTFGRGDTSSHGS